MYGWESSLSGQLPEFREQSLMLLVESEKCGRHLKADPAVHSIRSLAWWHRCFCDSLCTQVMHLSSKFMQRHFGRASPEPLSDTTFLDTESAPGERIWRQGTSSCGMLGEGRDMWVRSLELPGFRPLSDSPLSSFVCLGNLSQHRLEPPGWLSPAILTPSLSACRLVILPACSICSCPALA